MIISCSRRTDIPNYYADWFLHRIKEGFLYVKNPMNPHQISRIDLSPDVVDCIVFWTKNPAPMLKRLDELRAYPYYFQFTLTGYGKDLEPGLPDKRTVLIPTFRELSEIIGAQRVIWRYDPILFHDRYTSAYHLKAFEEIAHSLCGYTKRVVISFIDLYAKTMRNMKTGAIQVMTQDEIRHLAGELAVIAKKYGLVIETCAEQIDLTQEGIRHGSCIDKELIEEITGCRIAAGKDRNQRKACGCIESVEVGAYHTCLNGCRYCYANESEAKVAGTVQSYDVKAPLLCGAAALEDKITERKMKSLKNTQLTIDFP